MSNTLTNSVINCKFYSNPALLQVDISDSGFYSCVAGNILGESVSSAYLEINASTSTLTVGQTAWLALMGLSLLLQYSHHIILTAHQVNSQHLRTFSGVK